MMSKSIEVTTRWGFFAYAENEEEKAVDTELGRKCYEVPSGISLEKLRSVSRNIVLDDPTMIYCLAAQLSKWQRVRWFDWRSVGIEGRRREQGLLPSVEARRWLWRVSCWHRWEFPLDLDVSGSDQRVSIRWTRQRQMPYTDYVKVPDKLETYVVIPACKVRSYYCVQYPASGVLEVR